jgi:chemotaxis protein methyltransferase CheR
MKDADCVRFLQWLLPQQRLRWPGFRKVRRQVCKRIDRRLVELGLADVDAYQDWISAHPDELAVLDGCCQITISRFYRDRGVFDHLRETLLFELATAALAGGRDEVRCWSAGCASGEEPYTVNVIWKHDVAPRAPGLALKVVATDSN